MPGARESAYKPYASSNRNHSSLRVGNDGTACQRSSSGTAATTAIVAACSASATSAARDRGSDDDPPVFVDHDAGGAGRVTADKGAAGVRRWCSTSTCADAQAGRLRRRKRVTDGPDLRVGEDHARRAGPRPRGD